MRLTAEKYDCCQKCGDTYFAPRKDFLCFQCFAIELGKQPATELKATTEKTGCNRCNAQHAFVVAYKEPAKMIWLCSSCSDKANAADKLKAEEQDKKIGQRRLKHRSLEAIGASLYFSIRAISRTANEPPSNHEQDFVKLLCEFGRALIAEAKES